MNLPNRWIALAAASYGLLGAAPAAAASLQRVEQTDWWAGVTGLPSYVNMYLYVPDQVATKPPIVVAPHHCQGNGQGTYGEMSSLVSIAVTSGFILIFPEATGQNCWDAGSSRSLSHGGKGDTGAIVQMVKYTLSRYNGDAARVYSVGGSSGGIMTEALLGVYPDVFMAGVSLMGVPCGCWAQNYNDVTGTGSNAQWSGPCAGGNVTKTGAAWGDLVRSYFPSYTGHRPRLQHWHGTADTTLNFKNMAEDVKEWTNLLGLSETPTATDMPASGTTRQLWKNSCGYTVYETFALSGVGHSVPFDGRAVAAYFGLDRAGGSDPETAACGSGMAGMGGVGGAGGKAGAGGIGTGGAAASGGASSTGGNGGAAGTSTSNGGMQAAGSSSIAGEGGAAGSSAIGGATATGGAGLGSGGLATAGAESMGGSPGSGGASAPGGTESTGPAALDDSASSSGCACDVVGGARHPIPSTPLLVLAGLAWLLGTKAQRVGKRKPAKAAPPALTWTQ